MALQSSGQISISDIKAEQNNANNSLRGLSAVAGFSTPDAMSEFYGYSSGPSELSYITLKIDPLSSNQLKFTLENFDGAWSNDSSKRLYFDITLNLYQYNWRGAASYRQNHIFSLPLVRGTSYSVAREALGWGNNYQTNFDLLAFNVDFELPVAYILVKNKSGQTVPLP